MNRSDNQGGAALPPAAAADAGLPRVERIDEAWLDPALLESVPVEWVRRQEILPVRRDGVLWLLAADASNVQAYEDLSLLLGADGVWATAPADEIVKPIHDRMPVRIPEALIDEWLSNPERTREILDMTSTPLRREQAVEQMSLWEE